MISPHAQTPASPEIAANGAVPVVPAAAKDQPQARQPAPPGLAASGLPAAGQRGRTTVSRQAVEKIVSQLVAESPETGEMTRRLTGASLGERRQDAKVTARLHGTTAVSLAIRCAVPYPRPVGQATEALRRLLIGGVGELTGLRVQRVDITVRELTSRTRRRRVE